MGIGAEACSKPLRGIPADAVGGLRAGERQLRAGTPRQYNRRGQFSKEEGRIGDAIGINAVFYNETVGDGDLCRTALIDQNARVSAFR